MIIQIFDYVKEDSPETRERFINTDYIWEINPVNDETCQILMRRGKDFLPLRKEYFPNESAVSLVNRIQAQRIWK